MEESRSNEALQQEVPGRRPSVGVVVATRDRPGPLRAALASILEQDYAGDIEVVVVFDQSEPDLSLERADDARRVRVVTNARTPGLAGGRNTGILELDTPYVAFCDDDDEWLPGKLEAQVALLESRPDAVFCTTAMRVTWQGQTTDRLAGVDEVTLDHLARSRMAMLHSSAFVFRRVAALEQFGLVDETLPKSMAEDWDLLIRAARVCPVVHIDVPYVLVVWGASSYFNDAWFDRNEAHQWLIDHHPEFSASATGLGLMHGKLAFGNAAVGQRRRALQHAGVALRANWHEPRAYLALAVAAGVPARVVTETLNKRGHGI
ncbi:glycosyltransferase family 2 protein [Terrabacter sp. NPDC000476]|uniref:glycosyltransferase family 2 protein n=1 Tax=Terrabacter sp. NPDC000476 TaxID=3154258 RepID=UPI0033324FC7